MDTNNDTKISSRRSERTRGCLTNDTNANRIVKKNSLSFKRVLTQGTNNLYENVHRRVIILMG